MTTRSLETEHDDECMHYDSDDERSTICNCSFMGLKRNQVIDYSPSRSNSNNSEIGDGEDSEELFEINLMKDSLSLDTIREECESTVFSLDLDIHNAKYEDNVVHVAVGSDGESSMEALSWALKQAVTPSTTVCLLHVFPKVKLIPSPLGRIPRSHVNAEYINIHLTQERGKRKMLLRKFVDLCVVSKVKVEMMLVEGDNVAKAIVDLVDNLDIRKLVIGKSRKYGSRRQNCIGDKVLKDAKEKCDIKIIGEGREVMIGYRDNGSVSQEKKIEARGLVPLKRLILSSLWLFRSRFF
ncbi:U-box domain-containing protein 35-like [Abrus precatorius]|uniref:U-box domain-containing protein 35-like n=1 Tax=Abrus precatorius TaxID=3816 RepID=A0A8B8MIT5_ABRPR|nr:U-box domain-containing protein 35-like [Abrus precatorius]